MKFELCTNDLSFEKLKTEWNDLLHQSASDNVFLSWEWQSTWWQHFGNDRLCLITFRDENGKLVGLAPLYWENVSDGTRSLSQIGCEVSDYLDIIAAQGREVDVYAALLDALQSRELAEWSVVNLCNLPAASPTNTLLKTMAEDRGYKTDWRKQVVSPVLELPATWDEYLETLDKKQRHELRRKIRRIEPAITRWYSIDSVDALDLAIADFIELHKKSRPDKIEFMNAAMQKFFRDIAGRLLETKCLQLSFLEIDGVRAAAIMNFIYKDQVLVYNSGYDPEKFGQFSPGVILFVRTIQDAIEAKRRVLDFLRGDEEYKYRFGAKDTLLYEMHIRRN